MSYSFSYKTKCKVSRISADNSKWNLCYRGAKVRVNGSLWSLGNLIQEAGANHICSNRGRQPVPSLLFILLVSSPYFKFSFFFYDATPVVFSFPLFFFFSGTSSPVFLFFFGPLLLADGVISIVPVFFWHSVKTHSGTCDHTHTWTFCFCLSISPSVYFSLSFICLSLCPPFSSDGEERSCSVGDEGVQAGWIRWVGFFFYLELSALYF